ncbi:calcium-binding protein [Qipengyuania sphaerica]|uniref:calcium-binding protein n=1 Tax=Qipengyuania sphaerica TaxID=2867243 RepID=UPI001C884EAD|nr:calcium-binding protein [Qipengyuania sphaerica]MBX7539723.1 hypothetical protein [Qipengyuania sphaerica]
MSTSDIFVVDNGLTYSAEDPSVATLLDGGFVVAYNRNSDPGGDGDDEIYIIYYDASGQPTTPAFQVNLSTVAQDDNPEVTVLANGNVLVVWTKESVAGYDPEYGYELYEEEIYAQLLDSSGNRIGLNFELLEGGGSVYAMDITSLEGGGFVVSYQDYSDWSAGVRIFDHLGNAVGNTISIPNSYDISITGLAGGGFAIGWQIDVYDEVADIWTYQNYVRSYSADGTAISTTLLGTSPDYFAAPDVASLEGGGFVTVWATGNGNIGAALFDSNGQTVGSKFYVNTSPAAVFTEASVIGTSDGGFVVAWNYDNFGEYIYHAQRYDAAGNADGPLITMATGQIDPADFQMSALADNGFVVTWDAEENDRDFVQGYYSSVGGEEISGTAEDEEISGGSGNDFIYGLGGNDIINGLGGNDTIDAGTGNDTLIGGAGDDILIGDAGEDTASYSTASAGVFVRLLAGGPQDTLSAGIDTLVAIENLVGSDFRDRLEGDDGSNRVDAGDGDDRVYGHGGNDVIVLDTGRDRAWGGADDDRIYGQDGNDRIYGDNGDDRLYGQADDDTLIGGAGNDEMVGGTGNDIYFVDDAGDSVLELADEGNDGVIAGLDYTLGDNVEILRMRTGDFDGTGNGLDNIVRGVGGVNVLHGMGGDDSIYGGTGNDTLDGGDGNDRLYGENGSDTMTGGAGADSFIFMDAAELGTRLAIADIITDFSQSDGDRMNLRNVDANINLEGDQNFAFIGTSAFSQTAGELRYFQTSTSTIVEMDVDGDGVGDLYIRLDGQMDLSAGDFVL